LARVFLKPPWIKWEPPSVIIYLGTPNLGISNTYSIKQIQHESKIQTSDNFIHTY
jgi:hypothetical protein